MGRSVPFTLWIAASVFLGAVLGMGSIFIIGFGAVGEFVRVFWGPAVAWVLLGIVAERWKTLGELEGKHIVMLVGAAVFFCFMPLRIMTRESEDRKREVQKAHWERIQAGNCEILPGYVAKYGKGPFGEEVAVYQDICLWKELQKFAPGNTPKEVANLKRYLAAFPKGLRQQEAENRLRELGQAVR
jgi:hypothetical protein